MDTAQYIKVGTLFWIIQAIPDSATGDTVTVKIKRLSDGYTWNFSTTEFTEAATSGTMTFVSDNIWKTSFTPPTEDTYLVVIEDSTLDVKYFQTLKATGAVAQSGVTGSELTTYAHVKEYLGLGTDDDETFIGNLITRVSDDIERECNRTFNASDLTEYYNGDGTNVLLTRNYPINSITTIHDDCDREYNSDDLIDSDNIIIDSEVEGRIVLDGTLFTKGDKNIKLVYNAGYSTIPTDLEQACIKRVAAEYLESKGLVAGFAEGAERNPDKLRKQANVVIEKYKRIR